MADIHGEPTKFDSIFWLDVDKIVPNPYQPRKEFDEEKLKALAESIRQYGVLQPLVVTRQETALPDGGIRTHYELIAGERRLRASKLIGLREVPAVIRTGSDMEDGRVKLELAIIENLQREDLNPIDRAKAFQQLMNEFKLSAADVAKKMAMTRMYVANTVRLLQLPEHIQQAVIDGNISEGHGRTLLMLDDRKEEQEVVFRDIMTRKLSVRDTENIARSIAVEKVRKNKVPPEVQSIEKKLSELLGTRVRVRQKEQGGELVIDYFSSDDLETIAKNITSPTSSTEASPHVSDISPVEEIIPAVEKSSQESEEEDLYGIKNFSL